MALQTAAQLGAAKVPKLALYEPPYASDDEKQKQDYTQQKQRTLELSKTAPPGDAAAYFLTAISPAARARTLSGQTHQAAPDVVAPVLNASCQRSRQ